MPERPPTLAHARDAAIRTVVVDDEPLARRLLRHRLSEHADVTIVGEAEDGAQAVERLLEARPDLVLLDVQMPGMTGLEVLDAVAGRVLPHVVFVTAYDHFAVRAFDYHAVDYILKPFDQEQIDRALERVRSLRRDAAVAESLAALLSAGGRTGPPEDASARRLTRIPVRSGDRYILVSTADIDWIEADGNYVRLHVGQSVHPVRHSIGALEHRLDPARFARVHRGTIVNLDRIAEIFPDSHGDCLLRLRDRTTLRVSRSYRARVLP